jgi:hypothetical protein
VRLDKALYGCVESAALWYDNLSQSMQNLGYECNKFEPCSFGDFALTTVPLTTNSPTACVEEAIVMLTTGNRTGTVKFLNLRTNKIVTRNE